MNRLRLDFTITSALERQQFLEQYLKQITFKPTSEELELMGNYILWGTITSNNKTNNTSNNKSDDKSGNTPDNKSDDKSNELTSGKSRTYNKKDTVAAKSGIEIRTSHGTWDSKQKAESLDALIESPTFNEASLTNNPIHYTSTKENFSRSKARKEAPHIVLLELEELWRLIDRLELLLNYYDLKSGKRKNPPREQLLNRFNEDEQHKLREAADKLNQYQYLKKRHELVELRKQQFIYRDSYAPTLLISSKINRPLEEGHISWDTEVVMAPLGLYYKQSDYSKLIFRKDINPEDYSEEQLRYISDFFWKKKELLNDKNSRKQIIDFRDLENVYQIISMLGDLREAAARNEERNEVEATNQALIDTLYFYIELADLTEPQKDILQLKINGKKNQEIREIINKKYGKSYTINYISTIFKQKIIKQINEGAQYHFEVIENLFFPENFRRCNFCGRTLLLHSRNFVKKSRSTTGFNSKCKKCEKKRRDSKKKEKLKND